MKELPKFKQWLNERFIPKNWFGGNKEEEIPTLTVAPPEQKEPDLRTALEMSFGRNSPHKIDSHLLDALASGKNIQSVLDQISASRGFGTRGAVQNFLTTPGSNLDKINSVNVHRQQSAQDFAKGY